MKKAILSLLLSLMLLCSTALAEPNQFFIFRNYGTMMSYENLVFCYAVDIFSKMIAYTDDELNAVWDSMSFDEDDDDVYDLRYWVTTDKKMEFQVQVKEQTYASFEEELANAHLYITFVEDGMKALGYKNIRQLHNGIKRNTPEGIMLETAYAFTVPLDNGTEVDIAVVYYDCYYGGIEYVFEMTSYTGDYETAQYLLDKMMQTVDIWTPDYPLA